MWVFIFMMTAGLMLVSFVVKSFAINQDNIIDFSKLNSLYDILNNTQKHFDFVSFIIVIPLVLLPFFFIVKGVVSLLISLFIIFITLYYFINYQKNKVYNNKSMEEILNIINDCENNKYNLAIKLDQEIKDKKLVFYSFNNFLLYPSAIINLNKKIEIIPTSVICRILYKIDTNRTISNNKYIKNTLFYIIIFDNNDNIVFKIYCRNDSEAKSLIDIMEKKFSTKTN